MCFVIAKDFNKQGCVAIQMHGGTDVVELKRELRDKIDIDRIQLVTISRPSAFGEYEPYTFAGSKDQFKKLALSL